MSKANRWMIIQLVCIAVCITLSLYKESISSWWLVVSGIVCMLAGCRGFILHLREFDKATHRLWMRRNEADE